MERTTETTLEGAPRGNSPEGTRTGDSTLDLIAQTRAGFLGGDKGKATLDAQRNAGVRPKTARINRSSAALIRPVEVPGEKRSGVERAIEERLAVLRDGVNVLAQRRER